jgi:hypothetical protein
MDAGSTARRRSAARAAKASEGHLKGAQDGLAVLSQNLVLDGVVLSSSDDHYSALSKAWQSGEHPSC